MEKDATKFCPLVTQTSGVELSFNLGQKGACFYEWLLEYLYVIVQLDKLTDVTDNL